MTEFNQTEKNMKNKARILLAVLISTAFACSKSSVEDEQEPEIAPASAPVRLWGEPGDKSTSTNAAALRIGLRGGYDLDDNLINALINDISLIDLSTSEEVNFDSAVDKSEANQDPHVTKTVYIDIKPTITLENKWYALKVKKNPSKWPTLDKRNMDDGSHIYYRFTAQAYPLLNEIKACQKGEDMKIIIAYSERIKPSSTLKVSTLDGKTCEKLPGFLDSDGKGQALESEMTSEYLCTKTNGSGGAFITGLSGVTSNSDTSIKLAGQDSHSITFASMVDSYNGCNYVYMSDLP